MKFSAAENLKAAALMVLAMSLFAGNDAIVKLLSTDLPVGEIMFLRGVLATVLLLAVTRALGDRPSLADFFAGWSLIRGALEVLTTYLFLTAIKLLPLATATTLLFAAPIFLTAVSAPLFGEKVGVWRWSAVVAGFLGVVIVAAPGAEGIDATIAVPIAAAFAVAARDIATRFVPDGVSSGSVTISSSLCVTFGGLLSAPWGWQVPGPQNIAWIAAAAGVLSGAYLVYVIVIRTGDLSFTAPFKYVAIVWAALLGLIFWAEEPGPRLVAGAVIIIGSGLVIFYRERRLAIREASPERQPGPAGAG